MYFLLDFCENPSILRIIYYVKQLLSLIFILVPIGLIIMVTLDLFRASVSSGEDEMAKKVKVSIKRIGFAVVLFFVPTIVSFAIGLVGDVGVAFNDCIDRVDLDLIDDYQKQADEIESNKEDYTYEVDDIDSQNPYVGGNSSNDDTNMKNNNVTYDGTIYVGDSRTVRMCNTVGIKNGTSFSSGSNELCIASSGQALTWFNNTAESKIINVLNNNSAKKYNIVINLGVNSMYGDSLSSVSGYIEAYNGLVSKVGSSRIVIVSVTQTDDELMKKFGYGSIKDSTVVSFNKKLIDGLNSSISYCDVHTYLEKEGFEWDSSRNDGLHYNKDTDKKIYNKIRNCLGLD